MLTDEELIDAITGAPTGGTVHGTVLTIGRAIEAAVLDKQGRLLREAQMLAAPHFTAAAGGNSQGEYASPKDPWTDMAWPDGVALPLKGQEKDHG